MTKPTTDQAQASPTKRFFVSMLTRDINGARRWCGLAMGNTFFRGVDHHRLDGNSTTFVRNSPALGCIDSFEGDA